MFLNYYVIHLRHSLISQEASKKANNSTNETILSNDNISDRSSQGNCTLHKSSKYLKMPRKLLLHSITSPIELSFEEKEGTKIYIITTYNC